MGVGGGNVCVRKAEADRHREKKRKRGDSGSEGL